MAPVNLPAQDSPQARHPLLMKLRNGFVAGLVLLAPIGITAFVFSWVFKRSGGILRPLFQGYLPEWIKPDSIIWDVFSTLVLIALITLLGLVSRYVMSRWFLKFIDRLIRSIPGVSAVYGAVKQIIDTFSTKNKNVFSKVVLVQFPRQGMYSVGFLTNEMVGEVQEKTAEKVSAVFVPTTPNPTTGFLIMLPKEDIIELDMTVGEGMKMIVSVGAVTPPWPPDAPKPEASELMKNE
ncbi:putative membrane protein [Ereboglobus sp. PH5-5]|uniref:DUF502 domain-containing protein n=1 Tax=Ereboglobus sp. PH5-5 TaxID=2940529 RepID=UPI00240647C8|nr:DUF502 domain-containing protein [Ereboglobus sp. PH5-5]MDF9833439.1 putative membrane protein [Ereboglobus sp. PH5-5]